MTRRARSYRTIPYENATSANNARNEITKILKDFGCDSIGFMDDFEKHALRVVFRHRGRTVQLVASANGWAALWLKEHPYQWQRSRKSESQHKSDALHQGDIAINSILRDWVKGQVTAIECGVFSFEAVFMPHMITADGRSVLERMEVEKLLPAPTE